MMMEFGFALNVARKINVIIQGLTESERRKFMIIFANSRRSGKTSEAIKLAASTHSLLIVPQQTMADCVEMQAREMGYPVKVVNARYYFDKRKFGGFKEGDRIVIDELDMVLKEIFGCDVIMATTTGCNADIDIESIVEHEKEKQIYRKR